MPTIKDIARACDVSTATVSYVINGKNTLLPETRERVLRTMREMNYHPSAVARGLAKKRMNTLGILFDSIGSDMAVWHPYTSGILQGVLSASAQAGYNVTIFTELWHSAEQSLPKLRDQRTDGILIVAPPVGTDILPSLRAAGSRVVTISSESGPFGMPSVDVDNALGVALAVRHLRGLGHRHIAFLGGEPNMVSAVAREAAFRDALQASGIPVLPDFVGTASYQHAEIAFRQAQRLLCLPVPPTAIIAGNDQIAMGALDAAGALGIAVPDQLSVVGFDDIPDAARLLVPLTTLRQPFAEIGTAATRLLLRLLCGESVPADTLLVAPTLMVRATTAPPAK